MVSFCGVLFLIYKNFRFKQTLEGHGSIKFLEISLTKFDHHSVTVKHFNQTPLNTDSNSNNCLYIKIKQYSAKSIYLWCFLFCIEDITLLEDALKNLLSSPVIM